MTKDEYIAAIAQVRAFQNECDQVEKLVQTIGVGSFAVLIGANIQEAFLDLVEEAVGDAVPVMDGNFYGSWTRWYIYDTKQHEGKRWCIIAKKRYKVRDAADLYDVIQAWKKLTEAQ